MNYTLMPSLEHIALVKIATTLWNQNDIIDLVADFTFSFLPSEVPDTLQEVKEKIKNMHVIVREEWQQIKNEVMGKVSQLSQPESLKEEILVFVNLIGSEIFKWMDYHKNILSEDYVNKNISRLCWTPQGTVDKEKTAKILVQDKNLDVVKRYRLACLYCFKDYILILWRRLGGRKFYRKDLSMICKNEPSFVAYWSHYVTGEIRRYCRNIAPYEFAFQCSVVGGHKTATEYFFQKLNAMEIDSSLVKYTGYVAFSHHSYAINNADLRNEHFADVVCFLLSQMNEEQQLELFERYPCAVLECFLDWPWQRFFMKIANSMWNFLHESGCTYLLNKIADKVIEGQKDFDYRSLFGEFWKASHSGHKRYIIFECANGFLLSKLFKIKDEENIKLILKDATLREKKNLIFCERGQEICQYLIYGSNWELLKFFIQECISSKEEMIRFNEDFKECIKWCPIDERAKNKNKYRKFFQLLRDLVCGYDKRKCEEQGVSSLAKRLRSVEFKEVKRNIKK